MKCQPVEQLAIAVSFLSSSQQSIGSPCPLLPPTGWKFAVSSLAGAILADAETFGDWVKTAGGLAARNHGCVREREVGSGASRCHNSVDVATPPPAPR
ncbi:MAG: hypothetical protein U0792_03385 [Gemmataceae bacterium]